VSKQRVVLDANTLYGTFCRDLLVSLFAAGIYEAKWTERITQEWVSNLLKNRPDIQPEKLGRTAALMNHILPSALVERYEQFIGQIDLPDKDDRHVAAAAIACGAQKIVTWNLADFPNQVLKAFGITAENPDKFMADLIIDSPGDVVEVLRATRERFKAPPLSVDGFFLQLKNNRLELTAKQLERYRDLL